VAIYLAAISDDRVWGDHSVAILAFLNQPRDWDTLTAWARENRVGGSLLRNTLAWCEHHGFAVWYETPDGGRWAVPAAKKAVGE
jgi:hypothetical protein